MGVGAIVLDDDRVLMALRGTQPMEGYWSLPGGLVEAGESLADAVRGGRARERKLALRMLDERLRAYDATG